MVFGNKYIKFFLVLLQCCTSMGYGLNIDCNGKAFHCVNATHFKICVDIGGGISKTVDDFLLPCPDNTFCMPTNHYECEYHEITTSTTTSTTTITSEFSAITSDLSKVSVIPLLSAEKKSETTTAATVQDDAEYKVSSIQEILVTPSTVSILKIIDNTSNKPASKSVKDGKLTSATLLESNPTENFEDKSFHFNNVKKHLESRTENFVIINKTKYSSVISKVPNNISDKNVTLNESTKGVSVNNIENIDSTKLTEQKIILNETKPTEKNDENITSDDFENIFNTDNFSVEIKMNSETSENNIKNTSLNVPTNTGSEIDVNRITETTSLDPTLSMSYSASVEKSITENSTEANTSSIINIVLNKTGDENGIQKNISQSYNPISIAKSSLAVHNDSYDIQNIINTKLNVNGSETVDSRTVSFHKTIEKNNITNIVVTTTPTNNEKNNLQAATDNDINDVELLENFMNASTYPNIIANGNNLSFDQEKQTVVSSNSVVHKFSKGLEFEEENTINIANLLTFFEGDNPNSSLSLNSTESPKVLTTINVAELRDEMKIETNNASKFINLNNFYVSLNETDKNSSTTEITNVTFTTEKSSSTNQNNNINTYPEDNVKIFGDCTILNSTTQQPEIKTPNTKSENLNENYIEIIHDNNTPNILDLLTTTEYNEVVKTNTNNLNVEDFRDDLQKTLIQTETIKYIHKNETNFNVTDFTGKGRISSSNMFPNFLNASMSVSNFESNTIDASTNEVIKKAFDNKNDSDDVINSSTSSISYTNSLNITTNTNTVADLKDEVLMLNQKNSTSFLITFLSTTKNYDKDTPYTSYIDYKDTNIINTSTTSYSSFIHTTTESYKDAKTNENYSLETDLRADLTSSINDKKPLSDLLYSTRTNVLYITKNYNNSNNSEALNITTTSSIFHTSSLLATTERYEATSIALDHLSSTEPRDMVKQNIDGIWWLDSPSLVAVKNNTINATNALNGTSIEIGDDRKDYNNADSNINTTYSACNTSSLLITTDYDAISTNTDKLYMTNFENKIKLPNLTNTSSIEENIFITNVSKMSEIQNKTPISYNLQQHFGTETIPSVLKNTLTELYETTTQTGQNYFSENDELSNRIFSSIRINNERKNSTIPVNNFQEHFNNILNVTLLRFNETPAQIQQDEIDKQKVIMNSSEVNKHLLYPIHLLLLSKSNNSEAHNENLEAKVNLKPIHLDETIEQKIIQNASLDISHTHDFTTSTLIKVTKEYKSTAPLDPISITHSIGSTIININNTSKTNSSNQSVQIEIEISAISKESQFKQKLNTTESFYSTLPITLIESERINFTDKTNQHGTKHNITVENYDILEKDLPLKIAKRDETIDAIIPSQNKNYTNSNNASALFEDLFSTPETPSTIYTTLVPLFENDIISKEPIKATYQISIPNLSSPSVTSKHSNVTTNFINKLVTNYYARTSETISDVKLKINSENNYINSDTPMDLQITKRTLPSTTKPDTTLIDDTKLTSDILDTLDSTTPYVYNTNAYFPESQLRNIYKSSDSTLIDTISKNKESLQYKLSGIAFNDQPSTTQSIEINTGNTINNYLLTQVPAPALILTDKSQRSFVHNITENNLLNLSNTIAIRRRDALNSSTIIVDFKRFPSIININKPVNDTKNKEMNQFKELKTNASSSQLISNTSQNKTQYTGVNLDNASVTNSRNSTNLGSIFTPKKLSFDSPILIKVKATTVKSTINDSNSDITNVKNTPGTILGAKSFHSIQSKNYNGTQNVTTDLSKNSVKADVIKANKCLNQPNGKYGDKYDCKKFYSCLGDAMPVLGVCPNGTVFSESKKQCTKNLSQCYRNNQFTCLTPGRYYDLSIKNVYYICVKNRGKFIKFKYQCQNGYSLNETIVKCIKDSNTSAQNNRHSSNTKEDSTSISVESSSKATEILNIKSSKNGDTEFECKKEGKFPHSQKCNQYYQCTKIKKSVFRRKLKSCDSDEVFDKEIKQCVDTDSHEC